jgi:hypothetical protein
MSLDNNCSLKTERKTMTQVVKYNDKEYKLPFAVGLSDEPTATETVANRFSGEEVQLPQFATAVYDTITGAEMSRATGQQYAKDLTGSADTLQRNTWLY